MVAVLWHLPLVPVTGVGVRGRQKQVDLQDFEASLCYIHSEILSHNQTKPTKKEKIKTVPFCPVLNVMPSPFQRDFTNTSVFSQPILSVPHNQTGINVLLSPGLPHKSTSLL